MTLTSLLSNTEVFANSTPDEKSWVIAKAFGICVGWRMNFVVNIDGNFADQSGSSDGIASQLDRLLLGKLRSQADVIVTTGKTARIERYRSSKHAPIAILTRSADLDDVPAIQGQQFFTPMVLVPEGLESLSEANLSDVDVEILTFRAVANWPLEVSSVLHHKGFQSPIFEGGRSVAHEFITNHVIREICLTVTKKPSQQFSAHQVSADFVRELFEIESKLGLVDLFVDEDSIFTRWLIA